MKVFISYRRSDSRDVVGRLYDHLERRLGTQAIFKDTGSIAIGTNFADRIRAALQETDVVLVVIGSTWLSAQDDAYRRRIDDPTDWVRQEVELALSTHAVIVPVLIGDASLPRREHLPPSLSPLAGLQTTRLRPDPDFSGDAERLCQGLGIPNEPRELPRRDRTTRRITRSPTLQRPLLVSTVRSDKATLELQYTLLFGSPAAAAPTARKIIPKEQLGLELEILTTPDVQLADLSRLGENLADLLLPSGFVDLLTFEEDIYLLVFHDGAAAQVPWECVKFGDTFPAIAGGMSRRFISPLLGIPPSLPERFRESPRVLVIADPSGDLPGALEEAHSIAHALANSSADVELTMLSGVQATRESVTEALRQSFDLIHYAGHAFFDDAKPEASGLYLADRTILTAIDITDAAPTIPGLVLVSGAEAARISIKSTKTTMGLAEAFLRCGARDFIAPMWAVEDRSAAIFATRFYSSLFRGATVGTALREARLELWLNRGSDALNWVHFGLPDNAPVVAEGDSHGAV